MVLAHGAISTRVASVMGCGVTLREKTQKALKMLSRYSSCTFEKIRPPFYTIRSSCFPSSKIALSSNSDICLKKYRNF